MKKTILAILLTIALIGCQPQNTGEEISISNPFLGGTSGVEITFPDFRTEVFDGGDDPFDIVVQVENQGEAEVLRQNARIDISGINPYEFGKEPNALGKTLPEDLIATQQTPEGRITESPPLFVEFVGLNHVGKIAGARANYPIRANLCYLYKTTGVGELCVREKLLDPEEGGICEVRGSKQLFSSGAPVQITNLQQQVRSKDKIGFSFDVANNGVGKIYERGTQCDKTRRSAENKVYVIVDTGLPGVQCTGLQAAGSRAEGYVTLYGGSKSISCTQRAETTTDYKQFITLEAFYDYEQITSTTLAVKSSGTDE